MIDMNEEINTYLYELEDLSARMAENVNIGNFLAIYKMDQERKNIIEKISLDVANISYKNKKRLKLVWNNNNKLISQISEELTKKKNHHNKLKKTFKAYISNS